MRNLDKRMTALERFVNREPMGCLEVLANTPTPAQLAEIASAERTGRKLIVLDDRTNWAWVVGCGLPKPWEERIQ
jgi:hypothetical protein